MKKLPLGIQTFRDIIEENYLYVDKTRFIYKLVTEGKYYFLSRPRRFGKSLTLSTLGSLFEGEKELFKGLYIYDQQWDWKKRPVLRFDFSEISEEQDENDLKILIKLTLQKCIKTYNLTIDNNLPYNMFFKTVLEQLPEKAIILIDEYDKPILNNINKPEKAGIMKEVLKGFYSVIKVSDPHIHFAFLTGVTKFAKISVFSGLNNLTDLTMKETYSELCGYSEDELNKYFSDDLNSISNAMNLDTSDLKAKVKEWYNGFRFSSKDLKVYNPVSLMHFITDRQFKPYWFETATPTFLTKLMKNESFIPTDLEAIHCSSTDFSTYDIENLKALPILLQSGYLTIKNYTPEMDSYELGLPNREVKQAFTQALLKEYTGIGQTTPLYNIMNALKSDDLETFFENIDILFAKVPYDIHLKYEKYWQSLFYMIFTLMGYYIEVEYRTNRGRIDSFINMPNKVYLFEFKFTEKGNAERLMNEAETQIRETDYAKRFLDAGKPVCLLPVVFDYADNKAVILWKELTD